MKVILKCFLGRYEQVIEEQKETLQKERHEHTANVEKLQKAEQDLKKLRREIGGHYIE